MLSAALALANALYSFVCVVVSEGAGTRQEPNPSGAAEERLESCLNAARKIPHKAFFGRVTVKTSELGSWILGGLEEM